MTNERDHKLMGLALQVAKRGRPSPNPHVGAVIARGDEVLATGYHHKAGDAHAEVAALSKLGERARGATLYVTLEPCNHTGRTAPCVDAVLDAGIERVVIGCEDRIPGHGEGAGRLRQAGVAVQMGVRRREAEALVADFFKAHTQKLPFVTLKAAVTLDGRMASRTGDSRWITGPEARAHAHRMRDASDAIMVGVGTVLADDPALTVRHLKGRDPTRVVLDSRLLTGPDANLFRTGSKAPTWIFHGPQVITGRAEALCAAGAELFEVPELGGRLDLRAVLTALFERGVVRLLVEGGPSLHGALLDAGLVDWVSVFVAPRILGDATGMPLALGARRDRMAQAVSLEKPVVRRFGDDILVEGAPLAPEGEPCSQA